MGRGVIIRGLWSAGMLVWYFVFLWRVRIPRNEAAAVAVAAMVGGYFCGRFLGGYHSTAAFVGAILGGFAWLAVRRRLESWTQILEAGSFALPFAWVLVRLGCVVERGHPGLVTDAWFGLMYPDGSTRWDLALLEMLWALAMAIVFARRHLLYAAWLPGSLALFRLCVMPLQTGSPDFLGPAMLAGWCGFVVWIRQRPGLISTSTKF